MCEDSHCEYLVSFNRNFHAAVCPVFIVHLQLKCHYLLYCQPQMMVSRCLKMAHWLPVTFICSRLNKSSCVTLFSNIMRCSSQTILVVLLWTYSFVSAVLYCVRPPDSADHKDLTLLLPIWSQGIPPHLGVWLAGLTYRIKMTTKFSPYPEDQPLSLFSECWNGQPTMSILKHGSALIPKTV